MSAPKSKLERLNTVLVRGQRAVFEAFSRGAPLAEVLEKLCRIVDEIYPETLCSILLMTEDRLHLCQGAAPRLPVAYSKLIDGIAIGPSMGSCGTAAYRRAPVIVTDIATDPLWSGYASMGTEFGFAACASMPILAGPDETLLGTFALYRATPGPYSEGELEALRAISDLVGIAIFEHRHEKRRRDDELETMRTSQRMENLGLIAPGIAHDFNNLLTAILCNVSLAQSAIGGAKVAADAVSSIETISRRAADLARQMMAAASNTRLAKKPVDLNHVAREITQMLSTSFLHDIDVRLDLNARAPAVLADAAQLHQVLMNLVINAAQAIGDAPGGVIRVRTDVKDLRAQELGARFEGQEVAAGEHVMLEVSDTGAGMSPEVLRKIFDAHFTTKASGRGLGLAVLRAILRDHRAGLEVTSQIGKGTTFRAYFPVSQARAPRATTRPTETLWPDVRGKALVVEHEPVIRGAVARMLEPLGFDVVEAGSAQDAFIQLAKHLGEISLVVLDVAPTTGGRETLRIMRERWPSLRILVTASADVLDPDEAEADMCMTVLRKPYGLTDVRRALVGDAAE